MISDTISSSVIPHDIIDRYKIESQDFVTRCPAWIYSAMQDIGIRYALKTSIYKTTFANNRVLLPKFCDSVDMVLINDRKVDYAQSLYVIDKQIELNRIPDFIGDSTRNDFNNQIIDASHGGDLDPEFANSDNPMFYRVENGWLHTNVRYGTIEIKHKHLPYELDEMFGIEFPIIPDGHHVKEAIMWFVLRILLMRGYSHPVLNLRDRSPYVNPGLAYDIERIKALIELGTPNRDAREKLVHPMSALFGKRRPIWIKAEEDMELTAEATTRWVADGPPYCEVINGFNTGIQFVPMKEQAYSFGEWVDTLQTRIDSIENTDACPILLTRAGYQVGVDFSSPTYLAFNQGINLGIAIEPVAGYNYLFVSIPVNKTYSVIDNNSVDITSEFVYYGTDNREGFVNANVYRTVDQFYTGDGFEFIIVVE